MGLYSKFSYHKSDRHHIEYDLISNKKIVICGDPFLNYGNKYILRNPLKHKKSIGFFEKFNKWIEKGYKW